MEPSQIDSIISVISAISITSVISVVSAIATACSAIFAAVMAYFTYKNLQELKFARIEGSRAYISVNFVRIQRDEGWRIVIKNYGQSPGTLKKVVVDPPLTYDKIQNVISYSDRKFLTDATDLYLAPGQAITDAFPFNRYQDKIFNISVTYSTMGNEYTEKYKIDLTFRSDIRHPAKTRNTTLQLEESLTKIVENSEWFFEKYP